MLSARVVMSQAIWFFFSPTCTIWDPEVRGPSVPRGDERRGAQRETAGVKNPVFQGIFTVGPALYRRHVKNRP